MLKELIDKFYLDKSQDRDQVKFYITDAGKCNRAIFFKFKKAPKKNIEPRILRMFEHGDYIHQLIMKSLFSVKNLHIVASEVSMPPQEMISGRADAILSFENELYVLDIKSMNSMIFKNLTAPKEENIDQLQLYLYYFKVKKGILLYVDKDRQELKEFIIQYDIEHCQDLLNNFKSLQKNINSDVMPYVLDDYPKNWQCNYCQFKEICKIIGREEINWLEFKDRIEQINQKN